MNDKAYKFTPKDQKAILHFLFYGNMSQAYKYSLDGNYTGATNNLSNIAGRYFATDKLKALLIIEKQKIKDNEEEFLNRIGLKKDMSNKSNNLDSQLKDLPNLDKDQAETLLNQLINDNKTDPKIVKDLMAQLIQVNAWKGQTNQDNSNIIEYQLPSKR